MRNILCMVCVFMLLTACDNKQSTNKKILSDSFGNLNEISVVIDNELWDGSVGETIRDVLAAPIFGLNQDEPMFSMTQIPPQVFSDFVTKKEQF